MATVAPAAPDTARTNVSYVTNLSIAFENAMIAYSSAPHDLVTEKAAIIAHFFCLALEFDSFLFVNTFPYLCKVDIDEIYARREIWPHKHHTLRGSSLCLRRNCTLTSSLGMASLPRGTCVKKIHLCPHFTPKVDNKDTS